jgi:hypothetical protein
MLSPCSGAKLVFEIFSVPTEIATEVEAEVKFWPQVSQPVSVSGPPMGTKTSFFLIFFSRSENFLALKLGTLSDDRAN